MERGSVILTAGFTMIVGLFSLNMTRSDMGMSDNADYYAHKRQARQISLAGTQIAINNLRSNPAWQGQSDMSLLGGRVNISAINIGSGQIRVASTGYYGQTVNYDGQTHQSVSIVQIPTTTTIFDMTLLNVQTAMEVQGQTFAVKPSNLFFVDGTDSGSFIINTKYGIGASPSLTAGVVSAELINAAAENNVVGLGPNPSVTTLTTVVDMNRQVQEVRRVATIIHHRGVLGKNKAWGTMTSPEIVYVTKSLTIDKNLTGVGILCIEGDLNVQNLGSINWSGYVIVHGNIFGVLSGGSAAINGAVFFGRGGNTLFGSDGNMTIVYSSDILNTLNSTMFSQTGKPSLVKIFE